MFTSAEIASPAGRALTRSTTEDTSTIAPVWGSTKVCPLNSITYSSGIGSPISSASVARSSGVAKAATAAIASSTGKPAASNEGLSWSNVNDRGSGTTASRLCRYASVSGCGLATLASKPTSWRPSISSVAGPPTAVKVAPISSLYIRTGEVVSTSAGIAIQ